MKKTYSEMNALAREMIRKVASVSNDLGAVVIIWNRGEEKTQAACANHVGSQDKELRVVQFIMRCYADQLDATETLADQGLTVTPGGLLVPKKDSKIIS